MGFHLVVFNLIFLVGPRGELEATIPALGEPGPRDPGNNFGGPFLTRGKLGGLAGFNFGASPLKRGPPRNYQPRLGQVPFVPNFNKVNGKKLSGKGRKLKPGVSP